MTISSARSGSISPPRPSRERGPSVPVASPIEEPASPVRHRQKITRNLDLAINRGSWIEHTYKNDTARAIYVLNNQVLWSGKLLSLSGFCKEHVKQMISSGKIQKGCLSWNGWDACNLPGKPKGVWGEIEIQ